MHAQPSPAPRTLLLIGGSGFFGKSILDAYGRGLLAPLQRVVVLARNAQQLRHQSPDLCGPGVELVNGDVLALDSTFDADLVIHAAASSDARRYQSDPAGEMRIIVEGTRRVCQTVARSKRPLRFLYVSSGAVYGRQPSDVAALGEDAPLVNDADPVKQAYTDAKRQAETIVADMSRHDGVSARLARCFAFVGRWLPRDQHFAMGNFLGNAANGRPIIVQARHPVIRSYMHADDLAVWLHRLAATEGGQGEVFNVGSDQAVSIRDLASQIAELAGVPVSLPEPFGLGDAAQLLADRYVPNIDKARSELGLSISLPLQLAIERTLAEIRDANASPPRAHLPEIAGIAR